MSRNAPMMSDPGERLQILWDHHCIRQALERYCRGRDRLDKALIDSAFWPDAAIDIGPWQGKGGELSALLLRHPADDTGCSLHVIGESNIELDGGERAVADTYFVSFLRSESDRGVAVTTSIGRYVDRLEKRGEEWRIAARTVVMEHVQLEPDARAGELTLDMFRRSRRGDRSDLSYEGRAKAT